MRCVPSSIKLDGESNRFIEVFFAKIFFMVLKIKINEKGKKKKPIYINSLTCTMGKKVKNSEVAKLENLLIKQLA